MEVEQTINNWLEQAILKLEKETLTSKEKQLVYDICHAALRITKVYSNAIVKLLKQGFRLPAKALLRVLAELAIRLIWCLHSEGKDSISTRISSWHKLSNKKYLNLLENFMPIINNKKWAEEQVKKAEQEKKDYEKRNIPEMPWRFEKICEQISPKLNQLLRPELYLKFHHAVHIDAYLLRNFINDSQLRDTPEKAEELEVRCLVNVFFVIWAVYSHWGWSLNGFLKEYEQICNSLGCNIDVEKILKNKKTK